MAGELFVMLEEKIRPGVYVRVVNRSPDAGIALPRGIVGAIFRATWGPVGAVQELSSEEEVSQYYGEGAETNVARQAFRGGARRVKVARLGTGGVKATLELDDGAALAVARVDAKYAGTRGNDFDLTVRDSLTGGDREAILFEGTTVIERHEYNAGDDEAAALAAAFAASPYVDVVKLAVGDGTVANVAQAPLAGGTQPTTTGAALTTALGLLEVETINVLAVDVEDTTSHATIDAWIANARANGKRVFGVVGEPVSVAFDTRTDNSAGYNNEALAYVLNGFKVGDTSLDGYEVAARVAGVIASAAITDSVTHHVIGDATDLVGPLTGAEIEDAIQAGALAFTRNSAGQVQIEYGVTTLVNPPAELDNGWKKIRRTRTRDELISLVVAYADPLIGKVNNDTAGRAQIRQQMQIAVDRLVDMGALNAGSVSDDAANPPVGDSAHFVIEVDDNDSAEKIYITFGFRLTAPAAA